jgi:hypothetical protein
MHNDKINRSMKMEMDGTKNVDRGTMHGIMHW